MDHKCRRCGAWFGTGLVFLGYITTHGREILCMRCSKTIAGRGEIFSLEDATRDWENGNRSDVVKDLRRFPRWVSLAFGFAVLEHFGKAAYTHFASLMESDE